MSSMTRISAMGSNRTDKEPTERVFNTRGD
jgi:hypothetical protein